MLFIRVCILFHNIIGNNRKKLLNKMGTYMWSEWSRVGHNYDIIYRRETQTKWMELKNSKLLYLCTQRTKIITFVCLFLILLKFCCRFSNEVFKWEWHENKRMNTRQQSFVAQVIRRWKFCKLPCKWHINKTTYS